MSSILEENKKDCWMFTVVDRIEEATFNPVLERFYNFGISGLVRENIQNSLDGKISGENKPVVVSIKIGEIEKVHIPGIEEIKKRILSLKGRNSYTRETIQHMKKKMVEDRVSYISFEDSNTKGLKGALNGQSDSNEDTWSIYAYNKGVHAEAENEEFEKVRGGSHGIGKIASNAASELNMMFFANCDDEGNKHLGGTVQLIEHEYESDFYRSTGYFTDEKIIDSKTKFYPFENKFHQVFSKDARGLKIIIPFLREQFNDEKDIIKSVCDSFFIAIMQEKLQVIVNEKVINSSTIQDYITNSSYYEQAISEIKEEFTPLYFRTFTRSEHREIIIKDSNNDYKFKLYFTYDEEISKGRVAIVRTIGMKIEDKKIKGNVNKPFNAVLIPGSEIEDMFLKSLENESHTELASEHIKDLKLQRNAKRFINNISKEISSVLDEEIKKKNPTDGVMNTKDILYIIESQFKKDLSQTMDTVKLNKGEKERIVAKLPPPTRKTKEKSPTSGKDPKPRKKPSGAKEVKREKKDNEGNNTEKETRYNTHPDIVQRLLLSDREVVIFDFTSTKELKDSKLCDVALLVVNGMGEECPNEFKLNDGYESAKDISSGKICSIKNNLIKDVKIINGVAQIEFKLKSNFNRALKFVYYVEV
ncbi:hypothetical protein [Clostridium sp.]|uniref:hypothetical protein n=1 Tax=Clostridium sp. TaxID=1506 RepID=UPI0032170CC4